MRPMVLVPCPCSALLYDVHGNLAALDAVLADARAAGRRAPSCSAATTRSSARSRPRRSRACSELDATWIRGNGERWTAHPDAAPDNPVVQGAIAACRDALGADDVADPRRTSRPRSASTTTLYVHGSPLSDVRSFLPTPADDEDELLEGVGHARAWSSATPTCRSAASAPGAGSSWSTRARSGCRSTATRAPPRRSCTPTAASSTAACPTTTPPAPPRVRERFDGAPWTDTVAARIERATFDV